METKTIKAVETIRRIRDEHYEILRKKTSEEIKIYFRKAADLANNPLNKEHIM
jgi:hypothetical protein